MGVRLRRRQDLRLRPDHQGARCQQGLRYTQPMPATTNPDGIWSNNITMWVSDFLDNKLYAYSMATKARDPGKDITTAAAFSRGSGPTAPPCGLPINSLPKIHAYTLATGVRDAGKDFGYHSEQRRSRRNLVQQHHHVGNRQNGQQDLRLQHGQQGARRREGLRYPQRCRQRQRRRPSGPTPTPCG